MYPRVLIQIARSLLTLHTLPQVYCYICRSGNPLWNTDGLSHIMRRHLSTICHNQILLPWADEKPCFSALEIIIQNAEIRTAQMLSTGTIHSAVCAWNDFVTQHQLPAAERICVPVDLKEQMKCLLWCLSWMPQYCWNLEHQVGEHVGSQILWICQIWLILLYH